ncbi:MAG: lipoyl(octanoyl) transferase LipB [Breznakibacter sp.]|nr:lipoyl(octanoyl) transferase LipB [Breznakibacter sp.]
MMSNITIYEDLKKIDYKEAWEYQETLFKSLVDLKLFNRETPSAAKEVISRLLFCEHNHVYTLGKSGVQNNLLINEAFLKSINATFYKIDRGGDITYHGDGQITGYPIFDIEAMNLSIKEYIHNLEEAIILTIADYGIKGDRLEGSTGVWLDVNGANTRKICAIGVKASRGISMHGFALNVNTNLSYFNHINPCGFVDKGVTSMQKELGLEQDFEAVKLNLKEKLRTVFKLSYI